MRRRNNSLVFFAVAMTAALAVPAVAQAEEHPFAGRIVTSNKRIASTDKATLEKQHQTRFYQDAESGQWHIHYAAFFKRPLKDLEVTIKVYDVTDKRSALKGTYKGTPGRGQTHLISYLKLDREKFGVNRRILMVVDRGKDRLAETQFELKAPAKARPKR